MRGRIGMHMWNWGLKNRKKNQSGRLDSYRKIYEFLKCTMYLANHQSLPQWTMCFIPMLQEKRMRSEWMFQKKKSLLFPCPNRAFQRVLHHQILLEWDSYIFTMKILWFKRGLKVSPSCARVESMTHVTCLGDCDQE
jgi:hypothetical protein